MTFASSPSSPLSPSLDTGFAERLGIRVERVDTPLADGGCGAVAAVSPPEAASGGGYVPTGILLALVDATARSAAEAAVTVSGRRATLAPTATGVQFREPAQGTVTARASVPCEGMITDRADDRGRFRFSVAVDVVDPSGARVATGTVQWLAQIDGPPADEAAADGAATDGAASDGAPRR